MGWKRLSWRLWLLVALFKSTSALWKALDPATCYRTVLSMWASFAFTEKTMSWFFSFLSEIVADYTDMKSIIVQWFGSGQLLL